MSNLNSLNTVAAANAGAVLELIDPITGDLLVNDDDNSVMSLKILGSDSDRYRKIDLENTNQRIATGGRGNKKVTAQELETGNLRLLVGCTVEWNLTLPEELAKELKVETRLKGPVPAEASRALTQLYMTWRWMRDDAKDFMETRVNFGKPSI